MASATNVPERWISRRIIMLFVTAAFLFAPPATTAQRRTDSQSANYELAARFAPYKIQDLIYSTSVSPRWIEGGEKFWYEWKTSDGTFYYQVDPEKGSKSQIFDNDRIAAELTRITRDPWDGQHLPIRSIKFIDENTLQFEVESSQDEEEGEEELDEEEDEQEMDDEDSEKKSETKKKVFHFEYDIRSQTLRELEDWEEPDNHASWANISPDGNTVVFARNHNLYKMSGEHYKLILDARRGKDGDDATEAEEDVEIEDIQLTTDGEEYYSYASGDRGQTDNKRKEDVDKRKRAGISWSHNSQRFSIVRRDQREVGDLWVIHSVGNERPELESYKYDMPGEEDVTLSELSIYDLSSSELVKVQADAFADQSISVATARQFFYPDDDEPRRSLWLSENPDELYFVRSSRDLKRIDVAMANAETGEVRTLIEERLNTYVETQRVELLPSGDILWWSERDGWGHIYRFGTDGTLKNRLTEGPWSVRRVLGIDDEQGVVYFLANGKEEGEDPYYQHAYRVGVDGSGLRLLDAGEYDHRASFNESNRFFVDNSSRVDTVPASALYDASGRRVMDLEEADFSKLLEAGYQFPETYTVKAADRVTDLYGVMYKPFDFDSTKSYPIIEYVYPGPQTESVSKSFSTNRYETALAQFGFIVVTIGNRGGHPARSKWYHNYGYGNLRDYGLADKKVTVEQLADRHDFIDRDKVGIYGHSGGGFMSTAAMLVYPDLFKVAVSSSGNHTNDIYNRRWSEKHHGVKEVVSDSGDVSFEYSIETNPDLAKNLKGHLLLTTGDQDNNVHPGNTYRMADALIKANKRFDFFLFTGQRHGYGGMSNYWFWLRAEYFVKHLLGDTRWEVDIAQLNVEQN
ncbi:MAG: DPP IV N-terminal domain-containing protein [Bacteroidetes bacterium]|nr:DPP IV N-terminal domain-containing protein [Bacteroidota bacterium]